MEVLQSYFNSFSVGISLSRLGFAFLILVCTLIIRKIVDIFIKRGLKKFTLRTRSEYDDLFLNAITSPVSILILVIGGYLAIMSLRLPSEPYNIPMFFTVAFRLSVSFIVIWTLYRLSNLLSRVMMGMFAKVDNDMADNFAPLISQAVKITIISLGVLVVIQNLGYSIGSVLAGLGIGGLAVALAAQDTLSNLFGTLVMVIDKPFKVGDWVQFRDIDGNVETIGFRSTKVRTWSKSLKIVPNKLLTSEIIENWSEMTKRRVKMTIGITYDSPPEKVMALRDRMEQILRDDPDVDQDYMLVYFNDFAPSSLEIFVYYFTRSTAWKEYLHVRQRINLDFIRAVSELGLSFAFPSQTVYFANSDDDGHPAPARNIKDLMS
ncbi:mechanosensitive ion channel family protein [bacterium]|nr:mechanosensitive ion channel family protein [candidate division CSSED10-310 bacterium]